MRTNSSISLAAGTLLIGGAALFAQATGDVVFSAPAGAGGAMGVVMGVPGPQTFAFVAGELSGSPVKGAPYSAQGETRTTQTLADGNRIVNSTTATVYRDAAGRERREQSLPNIGPFAAQDAPAQTIFISDPVAGVNYSLNPGERVAIKLPIPQTAPNASSKNVIIQRMGLRAVAGVPTADPGEVMLYKTASTIAPNPPAVEQLGIQPIQGVSAEGTRTTFTIPAGQMGNERPMQVVDEVWRSSDLQVIVQSTHSDPRMGTTVYTLSNISRSDPSPALFQVPADYSVKDAPAAISIQKTLISPAQQ